MRPVVVSIAFAAADDDGICASQTPGAAGSMLLNGALVSSGVAILTSTTYATTGVAATERQVLLSFAADETGHNFVVTGTNGNGTTISETIAGANGGTATSVYFYATVTSITISAAATGAIKAGTNGVGATVPIIPDMYVSPYSGTWVVNITGTINFTAQETNDTCFTSNPAANLWNDITALASKAADTEAALTNPVAGYRIKQNSFTGGSLVATFIQAGW